MEHTRKPPENGSGSDRPAHTWVTVVRDMTQARDKLDAICGVEFNAAPEASVLSDDQLDDLDRVVDLLTSILVRLEDAS